MTSDDSSVVEEQMERRGFARHAEALAQLMTVDDVACFCKIFDTVNPGARVTPCSRHILTAAQAIARASYDGEDAIHAAVTTALDVSNGHSWLIMAIYYYVCRATTNPSWHGSTREASVYKAKMNAAFDGLNGWVA